MAGATAPAFFWGLAVGRFASSGSSPGGATESAVSDFPVAAHSLFAAVMTTTVPAMWLLLLRMPSLR